jgi:hypothetical protein
LRLDRLVAATLALVLVAGLGTPVFAQINTSSEFSSTGQPNRPLVDEDNVIFNGGTSDFNAIGVVDDANQLFAEDFQLQEDNILNDVHLDVLQFDPAFNAEFEYVVYADNGGQPGAVIQSGQGINEHKMLIPNASPSDFRYWFDLDNPLPLSAGTTYWIQLFVNNSPAPFSIAWWTTTPGFGNNCVFSVDNGVSWSSCGPFQLNLVLTGPSPDEVVGGELLQVDSAALLLAGLQSSAIWMIPILAGAVGAGTYYIKTRMNKD